MRVVFRLENHFVLCQHTGQEDGSLVYENTNLQKGAISSNGPVTELSYMAQGKWESFVLNHGVKEQVSVISLRPGGIIYLHYHPHRRRYIFRKSGKYGGRFDLLNRSKEEIITLLPNINWLQRGHEYSLQINEEHRNECTTLLILHTVHCANCLLGIINGSEVPALVDI
mgnify:CR=1 FL=1